MSKETLLNSKMHGGYEARARVMKAMAHPTRLFIVDNSLAQDTDWELGLFDELKKLGRRWISHPIENRDHVVKAPADAGCWYVYQAVYATPDPIREKVRRPPDHGIGVGGTVLPGLDDHTDDDVKRAERIWEAYQREHDVSDRRGEAVGIDPVSGRVWFGDSAVDIGEQMETGDGLRPLYFLRVGYDYYCRNGGHRGSHRGGAATKAARHDAAPAYSSRVGLSPGSKPDGSPIAGGKAGRFLWGRFFFSLPPPTYFHLEPQSCGPTAE